MFGWDNFAAPTDADGRFTARAPSGTIEVSCRAARGQWSDGAARVVAPAGDSVAVTVQVVVAALAWRGIGARIEPVPRDDLASRHVVAELRPGGGAEAAGLRVGDVIVAIDRRAVGDLTEGGLASLIASYALGQSVDVTVGRGAKQLVVSVAIEGAWER
jgi:hypothetical protein